MVVSLVAAVGLVACGEETGDEQGSSAIEDSGTIRWDLRDGLTREEVGLTGQRSRLALSPPSGRDTFDVEVVVGDDVTLAYDAEAVLVEGGPATDGEPSFVNLGRTFPTIEEATAELRRAVEVVGIDPAEVTEWDAAMRRARTEDDPAAFTPFVFRAPAVGSVSIEVEAATTLPDGRVTISYLLNL